MVKFGIIADTHISANDKPNKIESLLKELKEVFKDVDEIIHAGDICEDSFLKKLNKIAPTKAVTGEGDAIQNLDNFIVISAEKYKIGVTHEPPENLEDFCRTKGLIRGILIFGHTHVPVIKGISCNTLILNPGSTTIPKAPPKIKGFNTPIARPSVIKLIIENDVVSSYMINLKI